MDCPKSHLKLSQTSCQGCQTRQELPVSSWSQAGVPVLQGQWREHSWSSWCAVSAGKGWAAQPAPAVPCTALPGEHRHPLLLLPHPSSRLLCLQPHLHFQKTGFHQEAWFWHHLWKLPSFGRASTFLSRKRRKTQSKIICVRKKNFFERKQLLYFIVVWGF